MQKFGLLLAHVDGKQKVRIDSLVEIGDVVVEIRLADLRIYSADVGDELSWMWVTSCRKVMALRPSVGSSRAA